MYDNHHFNTSDPQIWSPKFIHKLITATKQINTPNTTVLILPVPTTSYLLMTEQTMYTYTVQKSIQKISLFLSDTKPTDLSFFHWSQWYHHLPYSFIFFTGTQKQ